MAVNRRSSVENTVSNLRKADAFFNISVKTTAGVKNIGGIPLYGNKELHQFLIDNADQIEKATFEVDIHVVSDEPQTFAFA